MQKDTMAKLHTISIISGVGDLTVQLNSDEVMDNVANYKTTET